VIRANRPLDLLFRIVREQSKPPKPRTNRFPPYDAPPQALLSSKVRSGLRAQAKSAPKVNTTPLPVCKQSRHLFKASHFRRLGAFVSAHAFLV